MTAPAVVPSLSVVIPVYNEAPWIGRCIADAAAAIHNSPFTHTAEFVIVDDGSDEPTKQVLAGLSPGFETRVITQENRGRFQARKVGIEAARGELVFLLDSRVFMAPESLRFVAGRLDGERLPAWNGHVEVDVTGNPFARFWRTMTRAAWGDYLANPRSTSFGIEEYDRFPKGTGCFLASRDVLLGALADFRSVYDDSRFSSDDTLLIRSIAEKQRINISPGFSSIYHSPDSLGRFVRHAFHRGSTFVDSFGRPGTRFFPFLMAFFPGSSAFLVMALMRPRLAGALVASLPFVAAGSAIALRRPPRDVLAFSALIGPFTAAYSAGIWRGALMAARARITG